MNNRGSLEAIAKRRAARAFNAYWQSNPGKLHPQGLRMKRRCLKELGEKNLKAIEVLQRVNILLQLKVDEKEIVVKSRFPDTTKNPMTGKLLRRMSAVYDFDPRAFKYIGMKREYVAKYYN